MDASRRTIGVYDILNAGPRRRFTAAGRLVSNCYGGEPEKLFALMSMARDKASGKLMFPDITEEMVDEWHEQWHTHHPETKRFQETCAKAARFDGYTATPWGSYRKRYFVGGPNKPGATFNHVIQGLAAEVANRALINIAKEIPYQSLSPFTGLCAQIHDQIMVYVPEEHAEWAKEVIERHMNVEVFGIMLTASAVISKRWSEQ